jgi:hypothetical protein
MASLTAGAALGGGQLRSSAAGRRAFAPAAAPAPRRGALQVVAGFNNMVKLGGGKKWERQELTANGKPVRVTMHVKAGDIVQVRSGGGFWGGGWGVGGGGGGGVGCFGLFWRG